jgi:hypothetical protein
MAALCGEPRTRGKHIPLNNSKLAESRHGGILAHHLWLAALLQTCTSTNALIGAKIAADNFFKKDAAEGFE